MKSARFRSAMHNVLLILLHRPFVSDGHLHSSPSHAINSFLVCATAAKTIVRILRAYDAAFSIRRAPYLISYATYVSATIHVRIAAQRESGSEAHACLATCLDVFQKNQATNWAVKRANLIIRNLMNRMRVSIKDDAVTVICDCEETQFVPGQKTHDSIPRSEPADSSENNCGHKNHNTTGNIDDRQSSGLIMGGSADNVASNLDIDAIIQSFIGEQQNGRPQMQAVRNNDSVLYPVAGSTLQWFPSASFMTDDVEIHDMQPQHALQPPSDAYGVDLALEGSLPTDFSVHDMLFGFNSSATEGIGWEFDDRVL
jgi:hypothetical protein